MNTITIDSSVKDEIEFSIVCNGTEILLELTIDAQTSSPTVGIKETDSVSFILRHPNSISNPVLSIQEFELPRPSGEQMEDHWVTKWVNNNRIFTNHFGWSKLCLQLTTTTGPMILLAQIEIYATKLHADNARSMLQYLENKMEDVTRSCFTGTSSHASALPSAPTILVLLSAIENDLKEIGSWLPHFRFRKRSRITPIKAVTRFEGSGSLSANSAEWLLYNLDKLVPASAPTQMSIPIRNKFYDLAEVQSDILRENTDVYENQIISGYLLSIDSRLAEAERLAMGLTDNSRSVAYIDVPTGFRSFCHLSREFELRFATKIIDKCKRFRAVCHTYIQDFNKYIPVSKALTCPPKLTPGFKSGRHYFEAFKLIDKWYRIGKLSATGEVYLYGLRTIDRLYEFFCLYKLIESLEFDGWSLSKSIANKKYQSGELVWEIRPAEQYIFVKLGESPLRLFYELELVTVARSRRFGAETLLHVVEMELANQVPLHKRRPDFLIEYSPGGNPKYIVLDAKYSKKEYVINSYLPLATMKYIHGIHQVSGGHSPVSALYLLYPRQSDNNIDVLSLMHQESSNMYSSNVALPIIGIVEITPEVTENDGGPPRRSVLSQTLKSTLKALKPHRTTPK